MKPQIRYYKERGYRLAEDYQHKTRIYGRVCSVTTAEGKLVLSLSPQGLLTMYAGYEWDGPSGPAIDTKDFMRGSLVHDALYQLMRAKQLPQLLREYADKELRRICREDGMSAIRAWWVYRGVRRFAGGANDPIAIEDNDRLFEAP